MAIRNLDKDLDYVVGYTGHMNNFTGNKDKMERGKLYGEYDIHKLT